MSKRRLSDLSSIIGTVTNKHKEEIRENTQEINVKKVKIAKEESFSMENNSLNVEHTGEFNVNQIKGIEIRSRKAKVPESFKIKPSLKSIVEEIVKEAKDNGQNISKGELYNLLIAKGLESIK